MIVLGIASSGFFLHPNYSSPARHTVRGLPLVVLALPFENDCRSLDDRARLQKGGI